MIILLFFWLNFQTFSLSNNDNYNIVSVVVVANDFFFVSNCQQPKKQETAAIRKWNEEKNFFFALNFISEFSVFIHSFCVWVCVFCVFSNLQKSWFGGTLNIFFDHLHQPAFQQQSNKRQAFPFSLSISSNNFDPLTVDRDTDTI